MKVFIAVLILTFGFQSWTRAEVKIDQLFGVKIFDDIEKFANKDSGEPQNNRPGTFYFSDKEINITINVSNICIQEFDELCPDED